MIGTSCPCSRIESRRASNSSGVKSSRRPSCIGTTKRIPWTVAIEADGRVWKIRSWCVQAFCRKVPANTVNFCGLLESADLQAFPKWPQKNGAQFRGPAC